MKITPVVAEVFALEEVKALDRIHVIWIDVQSGMGYVTIMCYGAAWTAYFGAMGGRTIREFFASCDTEYLVTKMGIGPHLKSTKRDNTYLAKIIDAVKESLSAGGAK